MERARVATGGSLATDSQQRHGAPNFPVPRADHFDEPHGAAGRADGSNEVNRVGDCLGN